MKLPFLHRHHGKWPKGRVLLLFWVVSVTSLCAPAVQAASWAGLWLTPDQQGQRLFDRGEFQSAAEEFADPFRKGSAFYRAGEFEKSAAVFGRINSPQAAYNRGNALLLLGQYDEAIFSYEKALQGQPGWEDAIQNRDIARARLERLEPPESDEGGTGGMLEADEIVFDTSGRVNKSGQEQEVESGGPMSDEEMRSVWLRRVQNNPADFLRARFAWQLYRSEQEESGAPTAD